MSRGASGVEQSHQVPMMPRLGPDSPGLGDAQIGSESPVSGEAKKVSTAIRSRRGTKSPGLGEAQMGTRFTRSM